MLNLKKHFDKLTTNDFKNLFDQIIAIDESLLPDKIPFFIDLSQDKLLCFYSSNFSSSVLYLGVLNHFQNSRVYKNYVLKKDYLIDFERLCRTRMNKINLSEISKKKIYHNCGDYPIDCFELQNVFDYSDYNSYLRNIPISIDKNNLNYMIQYLVQNKEDILLILKKQRISTIFKESILCLAALILLEENEFIASIKKDYQHTTYSNIEIQTMINLLLLLPKKSSYINIFNVLASKISYLDTKMNLYETDPNYLTRTYIMTNKIKNVFDKYETFKLDFCSYPEKIAGESNILDDVLKESNNNIYQHLKSYFISYYWLVNNPDFDANILNKLLKNHVTLIIEENTYQTLKLMIENDIHTEYIKNVFQIIEKMKSNDLLKFFK